MRNNVLLIGNGINNLTNKESWSNLLKSMAMFCKVDGDVEISNLKPFPLLYEEIFLRSRNISELSLKRHISKEVRGIIGNDIHDLIRAKEFNDIITTNYDYTLQGNQSTKTTDALKNQGVVKETKYNIFRHNKVSKTKVWHIHGECNSPGSITLGYEHYGGQLQQMRNYVVSGTHYKNKKNQKSLSRKLRTGEVCFESWLDLFFKKNIHIIGLSMDFVETDLWWLLTYRARLMKSERGKISNKIFYYTPQKYIESSKQRMDLMKSINIEIVKKNKENVEYYTEVLKSIN